MKQKRCLLAVLCSLIIICSFWVGIYEAEARESAYFRSTSISISSAFSVTFVARAKQNMQELGLKSYTLYTSTGKYIMSASPKDYTSGLIFSTNIDLSSHVEKGKSYYIKATFYADGETKTITSSTKQY